MPGSRTKVTRMVLHPVRVQPATATTPSPAGSPSHTLSPLINLKPPENTNAGNGGSGSIGGEEHDKGRSPSPQLPSGVPAALQPGPESQTGDSSRLKPPKDASDNAKLRSSGKPSPGREQNPRRLLWQEAIPAAFNHQCKVWLFSLLITAISCVLVYPFTLIKYMEVDLKTSEFVANYDRFLYLGFGEMELVYAVITGHIVWSAKRQSMLPHAAIAMFVFFSILQVMYGLSLLAVMKGDFFFFGMDAWFFFFSIPAYPFTISLTARMLRKLYNIKSNSLTALKVQNTPPKTKQLETRENQQFEKKEASVGKSSTGHPSSPSPERSHRAPATVLLLRSMTMDGELETSAGSQVRPRLPSSARVPGDFSSTEQKALVTSHWLDDLSVTSSSSPLSRTSKHGDAKCNSSPTMSTRDIKTTVTTGLIVAPVTHHYPPTAGVPDDPTESGHDSLQSSTITGHNVDEKQLDQSDPSTHGLLAQITQPQHRGSNRPGRLRAAALVVSASMVKRQSVWHRELNEQAKKILAHRRRFIARLLPPAFMCFVAFIYLVYLVPAYRSANPNMRIVYSLVVQVLVYEIGAHALRSIAILNENRRGGLDEAMNNIFAYDSIMALVRRVFMVNSGDLQITISILVFSAIAEIGLRATRRYRDDWLRSLRVWIPLQLRLWRSRSISAAHRLSSLILSYLSSSFHPPENRSGAVAATGTNGAAGNTASNSVAVTKDHSHENRTEELSKEDEAIFLARRLQVYSVSINSSMIVENFAIFMTTFLQLNMIHERWAFDFGVDCDDLAKLNSDEEDGASEWMVTQLLQTALAVGVEFAVDLLSTVIEVRQGYPVTTYFKHFTVKRAAFFIGTSIIGTVLLLWVYKTVPNAYLNCNSTDPCSCNFTLYVRPCYEAAEMESLIQMHLQPAFTTNSAIDNQMLKLLSGSQSHSDEIAPTLESIYSAIVV